MIGNLGMSELLVILGIAVLVFGAGRIPEIAKSLGKAVKEFKKATREIAADGDDASQAQPKTEGSSTDKQQNEKKA